MGYEDQRYEAATTGIVTNQGYSQTDDGAEDIDYSLYVI
jgi:hypothetical protein